MKRRIIAGLLAFLLLLFSFTRCVVAVTQSDLDEVESQKEEAETKIKAIEAETDTVLNEISDLEDSISEYESELETLNDKIDDLEEEIENKAAEIEELEEEYEEMQALLTDRLVAIYEQGQITFLDVILSAESIWDYISLPTRIQELTEADNEQMEAVEAQRQAVEKAQKELEEQNQELTTTKASIESKQAQLKTLKAEKEAKVSTLTEEQKELQAQIEEYNEQIEKMEAEIKAAAQAATNQYQGSYSGTLGWPVSSSSANYNVITSTFGYRTQPVAGATSDHRAIDIGVYSGTPVYSCGDGYVVLTSYNSARGYYVMIKHADNLYTLYQHLSSYVVSQGQTVSRGELIAYSGNTGVSSGPHLHLEVRTSANYGSEVNPLNYLTCPSNLIFY